MNSNNIVEFLLRILRLKFETIESETNFLTWKKICLRGVLPHLEYKYGSLTIFLYIFVCLIFTFSKCWYLKGNHEINFSLNHPSE